MTVNVGGINIGFGSDISRLVGGIDAVESRILKFQQKLNSIKLSAAIKGDPFRETRKYIATARGELNSLFDEWSRNIPDVENTFSKYAKAAKKAATESIYAFEKVNEKFQKLQKARSGISLTSLGFKGGTADDFFNSEDFRESLAKFKGISREADLAIQKLIRGSRDGFKNFKTVSKEAGMAFNGLTLEARHGIGTLNHAVSEGLDDIAEKIKRKGTDIEKEYLLFGQKLKAAMKKAKAAEFQEQLGQARSTTLAQDRRVQSLRDIAIALRKARAEIEIGVNVNKNYEKSLELINRQIALGIKLTPRQAKEYKRIKQEVKYIKKEFSGLEQALQNLFSPRWLASKALWFIQLRVLWDAWRLVGEAMRDVVQLDDQIARAMRTVNSEIVSQTKLLKKLESTMGAMAKKHGSNFEDVGEALYQLGSAGLSAEEAFAALDSVLTLIVGTEGDVRDVTKVVAGLYNNYADTITEVTTKTEKFIYITDLMAAAWQNHQIEINELTDGYKRSIAMTKAAGVSMRDLTALLAVANDHMIKGGNAGRALTNVFMRISRTPIKFKEIFKLPDEVFDPTKPIKLMEIIDTLGKRLESGVMSVYELGKGFEALGLRGAPVFTTLVQNYEKLSEVQKELIDNAGAAFDLEARRLDSFSGEWSRFVGRVREDIVSKLLPAIRLLKNELYENRLKDTLTEELSALREFGDITGLREEGARGTYAGFSLRGDNPLQAQVDASLTATQSEYELRKKMAKLSDETLHLILNMDKKKIDMSKELSDIDKRRIHYNLFASEAQLKAVRKELALRALPKALEAKARSRGSSIVRHPTKSTVSQAEFDFQLQNEGIDLRDRIRKVTDEIAKLESEYRKNIKFAESTVGDIPREAAFAETLPRQKARIEALKKVQADLIKQSMEWHDNDIKNLIEKEKLYLKQTDIIERGLKFKKNALYKEGITSKEEQEAVREIDQKLLWIDQGRAEAAYQISKYNKEDKKTIEKTYQLSMKTANFRYTEAKEKLSKAITDEQTRQNNIIIKNHKVTLATLREEERGLAITKARLYLGDMTAEQEEKIAKINKKQLDSEKKRALISSQIADLTPNSDFALTAIALKASIATSQNKYEEEQERLMKARVAYEKSEKEAGDRGLDQQLSKNIQLLTIEKQNLQIKKTGLYDQKLTLEREKEIIKLNAEILRIEGDIALAIKAKSWIKGDDLELTQKIYEASMRAARSEASNEEIKLLDAKEAHVAKLTALAIKDLRTQVELSTLKERGYTAERKALYLKGVSTEQEAQILYLNKQSLIEEQKRAGYARDISLANKKNKELVEKTYAESMNNATLKFLENQKRLVEAIIKWKKEEVSIQYTNKLRELKAELSVLKSSKAAKETIAKLELRISDLNIEYRSALLGIVEDEEAIAKLNGEISAEKVKQITLTETLLRIAHPLYDAYLNIKEAMKSFNELMSETITEFTLGFGSGIGGVLTNITGGFQAQQQEVINLQGELKELEEDYKNAINEGNTEEARNLKNQMAELREQISDLEDPIKNLQEAFRVMFKDLVDQIRATINEWIAMKIVMGIVDKVGLGSLPTVAAEGANFANYSGGMANYHATGGVTPNIKSFKKFSNGGVTNSLTAAVLGDNPSKKEIVIPTENISSNNVSGYMRGSSEDKVSIINVVTEQDLAIAMSKSLPGKVIVNRVYKDTKNGGKLGRQGGR